MDDNYGGCQVESVNILIVIEVSRNAILDPDETSNYTVINQSGLLLEINWLFE